MNVSTGKGLAADEDSRPSIGTRSVEGEERAAVASLLWRR
jgi:hypothetical protein